MPKKAPPRTPTVKPPRAGALAIEKAKVMLQRCRSVDEAKAIRDKAAALQVYARSRDAADSAHLDAAEIKVRAERRIGELTGLLEKAAGSAKGSRGGRQPKKAKNSALKDAGISRQQAAKYEDVAAVPRREFERKVKAARKTGRAPTTSMMLKHTRGERRDESLRQQSKPVKTGTRSRYPVIYADPPWTYGSPESVDDTRQIANQYLQMTTRQICSLKVKKKPIRELATNKAVLFLWVPAPLLEDGLEVVDKWGFTYRTNITWDKKKMGMGIYVRQQHEHLLIAVKGDGMTPRNNSVLPRSIQAFPRREHSQKPDEFYEIIEALYPDLPRIELFARGEIREGWDAYGNELLLAA